MGDISGTSTKFSHGAGRRSDQGENRTQNSQCLTSAYPESVSCDGDAHSHFPNE